MKRKEY